MREFGICLDNQVSETATTSGFSMQRKAFKSFNLFFIERALKHRNFKRLPFEISLTDLERKDFEKASQFCRR